MIYPYQSWDFFFFFERMDGVVYYYYYYYLGRGEGGGGLVSRKKETPGKVQKGRSCLNDKSNDNEHTSTLGAFCHFYTSVWCSSFCVCLMVKYMTEQN